MAGAAFAVGAGLQAVGQLSAGYGQYTAGKENAKSYKNQALRINEQKKIDADRFMSQSLQLYGSAITSSARGGLKISGSVAESINQSLTALNLDKQLNEHNLESQRIQALNNAKMARYQGKQALIGSILGAGGSASQSSAQYNYMYGKNTGATT